MAAKHTTFPLLLLSLIFVSQVSSDVKSYADTKHFTQALQVFNRGGVSEVSKYLKSWVFVEGSSVVAGGPAAAPRAGQGLDCGGLCGQRCSQHSRQNVCMRACGTCCERCRCVPPGTYGNREMCGKCYTQMTTHGNKTKCP